MRARLLVPVLALAAGGLLSPSVAAPSPSLGTVEQVALDALIAGQNTADALLKPTGTPPLSWCTVSGRVEPGHVDIARTVDQIIPRTARRGALPPPPVTSPATGAITISYLNRCASWSATGVFDAALGYFSCARDSSGIAFVTCTPADPSLWYCAAWGLSAKSVGNPSQVIGQVSCDNHRGAQPMGSDPKGARTGIAQNGAVQTYYTGAVNWPVEVAINCGAFDQFGADPIRDFEVTCAEPGARTDGSAAR